jgi:ribonuclease P protein component
LQRLKNKAQFQAVMAKPPVTKTTHFALHRSALSDMPEKMLWLPQADGWIGVLLPKRWAKRAVTRNTIRRQIYEVSKAFAAELHGSACVVRLRAEFSRAAFISATSPLLKRAVRTELLSLLARLSPARPPQKPVRFEDPHAV